jgi:hypothetical protein
MHIVIVSRIPLRHLTYSVTLFLFPGGMHTENLWNIYVYIATL